MEDEEDESVLKERRAVDGFEGSSSWVGIGVGFVVSKMDIESEPMLETIFVSISFWFFWVCSIFVVGEGNSQSFDLCVSQRGYWSFGVRCKGWVWYLLIVARLLSLFICVDWSGLVE